MFISVSKARYGMNPVLRGIPLFFWCDDWTSAIVPAIWTGTMSQLLFVALRTFGHLWCRCFIMSSSLIAPRLWMFSFWIWH